MIDITELTNDHVTTFQSIPEVVAELTGQDPSKIIGWIDHNADMNQFRRGQFEMEDGSVLVAYIETLNGETPNQTGKWIHKFSYFVRAREGASAYTLINALVDGVPDPGDGQRWRTCGLMGGILPVSITQIERLEDDAEIDYYAIHAELSESGDA